MLRRKTSDKLRREWQSLATDEQAAFGSWREVRENPGLFVADRSLYKLPDIMLHTVICLKNEVDYFINHRAAKDISTERERVLLFGLYGHRWEIHSTTEIVAGLKEERMFDQFNHDLSADGMIEAEYGRELVRYLLGMVDSASDQKDKALIFKIAEHLDQVVTGALQSHFPNWKIELYKYAGSRLDPSVMPKQIVRHKRRFAYLSIDNLPPRRATSFEDALRRLSGALSRWKSEIDSDRAAIHEVVDLISRRLKQN